MNRVVSVLLCLLLTIGILSVPLSASAAVLPDDYEESDEYKDKTYQDLGILEDQYDLIEPINNLFPIISPNSKHDEQKDRVCFYKGSYQQVEKYLKDNGMTDGLSITPPTKIKAEKFIGYSAYGYDDQVATVAGRPVKAYMVAANAIMAGCEPHHTPFCIAFVEALQDPAYLASLSDGNLTPMMYVNGPACHQIGIDNTQGMTTEETNIAIGRFMELALINFTDIERDNAFGYVQPLVFSENDETCLKIGWLPHHVEEGHDVNDNIITATSFAMWGNNITPATDLPEEIMKVMAWDITEKNLGALGSASVEDNANTKRLIFITESVATALATKYKSKADLEGALIENARRPLWMRTYAYYYANTGGALSKSFSAVYDELKNTASEDARSTASPPWMNGITYANIDTVATMKKGNTSIIVTGDSSRNKTQVMPGGVSANAEVKLSDRWDDLLTSINYFPQSDYELEILDQTITPSSAIPSVLTNGAYRILDPASAAQNMNRAGRVYYESDTSTLHYYAQGASAASSVVIDPDAYSGFIAYLTNLGYNSSFTVNNGALTAAVIRFSSNASKLNNNTVALTDESFDGMSLTLHANNTSGSNAAGGLAKDGATVDLSDTVTSFTVSLDGALVMGDKTDNDFVKLSGTTVTIDPTVKAGATAIIGASNGDGTYRTMTFVNGGDGTYKVTYNTKNTLSLTDSTVYLKGSFNDWSATDAFSKTSNDDIITLTKELAAGTYTFKLHNVGTDKWYGKTDTTITDTAERLQLTANGDNCTFVATGGRYEFKFELSTNKLSVFCADNNAADQQPTGSPETEAPTVVPTQEPTTQTPTEAPTSAPVTEPSTKTISVGVIEYLNLSGTYQVHYWGGEDGAGDVNVVSTGGTEYKAVGSSYWSNQPQKFNMYTAAIPADATGFKVHNDNTWFGEDGSVADHTSVYVFEYGNNYLAYYDNTPLPTEAPTEPVTEAPTQAPTDPPGRGYYLIGSMSGWTLDDAYKLSESADTDDEYTLSDIDLIKGDQVKVVYSADGETIGSWYPEGMDTNYGIERAGGYKVTFRPDGSGGSDWHEGYFKMVNEHPLYTITWVDGDGNTLKTDTVAQGATPAYTGADPTKAETDQYTYTFNNTWSPAVSAASDDVTYTAQFDASVRAYTVTWKNDDGTELKTDTVDYGTTPVYNGTTPTKAADAHYVYVFKEWSPSITAVTGDITYTAVYDEIPNENLVVTLPSNENISLSIAGDETIGEIKAMILQESGIPTELQKLIYDDRILEDAQSLPDYEIESGSTVKLQYNISHSLTLEGAIGINFYIGVPTSKSDAYTFTLAQGDDVTEPASLSSLSYFDDMNAYRATHSVDVPEMTDDVTLTLFKDGEQVLTDTFKAANYGTALFHTDSTLTEGDYYLVGNIGGVDCWGSNVQARYRFKRNWNASNGAEEYELSNVQLHKDDEIKVIAYHANGSHTWYPSGSNYKINADGTYTIWFRPQEYNGSGWYEKHFYVSKDSSDKSTLYDLTRSALMLGAKSQAYFGNRTDDLADGSAYLDTSVDYGTVTAPMINERIKGYSSRPASDKDIFSEAGLTYYGASLVLNDSTKIKIYFTVNDTDAFNAKKDSFTFSTLEGSDNEITPVLMKRGDATLACFEIPGIPAAELDNTYCIKLGANTYYYSALDYARLALVSSKTDLNEIGKALYWYNLKADNYFG